MSAPFSLGSGNPNPLSPKTLQQAHATTNAARNNQWPRLLKLLKREPERVNAGRLGERDHAPLRQLAHSGRHVDSGHGVERIHYHQLTLSTHQEGLQ